VRRRLVIVSTALVVAAGLALALGTVHRSAAPEPPGVAARTAPPAAAVPSRAAGAGARAVAGDAPPLDNLAAYIPAQCYAVTRDEDRAGTAAKPGRTHNGCFACHQVSRPPSYADDYDVQVTQSLPRFATINRWTNVLHPPPPVAMADAALLDWVRRSNYRGDDGAPRLERAVQAWDRNGNGKWDGFAPDCWFHADEQGWDRDDHGRATGWRAYAYAPMPGMFWPTNGSAGDAFIRLPEAYRTDAAGGDSPAIYALNLAILEATVRRTDVPIAPTDEKSVGLDLDGDGAMGTASRVAFAWPPAAGKRLHYVGQAASLDPAVAGWPAAGLYPVGTEIVHSVRYLDVAGGKVRMAARMKELRYMRKNHWYTYSDLDLRAKAEMREKDGKPNTLKRVIADAERGVTTGTGWRMQGFIEDAGGELRPETIEETAFCIGCHGGVGASTDSTFSFARKVGGAEPDAGWYHWEEKGLAGIREPRRADGRGEYAVWLEEVGGGDDFLANAEVARRFFGRDGVLRPAMARALAADISVVAMPSPERALDLDRAYLALVKAQSFARGRDVVLGEPRVKDRVVQDSATGITRVVGPPWKPAGR